VSGLLKEALGRVHPMHSGKTMLKKTISTALRARPGRT
jgi:hypothetical protein